MSHHEIPSSIPNREYIERPEYAPEKLEGVDQAAAGAVSVLEEAINGERHIAVSETERGLRGVVEASVPGGRVRGLFANQQLDQIEIALQSEDGNEHVVRIDKPESGSPMLYLDGVPANAEDMPSVAAVIDQIKAEREALQQVDNQENDPIS